MNRKDITISVLAVLLIALPACGYRVAGRVVSETDGSAAIVLPGNIKTVAIPIFINHTRKSNVESIITSAVAREFITSVDIVDEDEAEALLLGSINSYELKPVSFTATDVIQEYRLYIEVSITLMRRGTKEVLWRDGSITDYEDFIVDVNDISASKDAEWDALKIICFDMARFVKERMLEGF